MNKLNGRCFCGAVRLQVTGDVIRALHCHCESCRRATSSAVGSFFTVRREDAVLKGESLRFCSSSPGVRRGFCAHCGSPMSYESDERPTEIDLYIASLVDATDITIDGHSYWNERVPWLHVADDLPKDL